MSADSKYVIGGRSLLFTLYVCVYLIMTLLPQVKYSTPYRATVLFCMLPILVYALRGKYEMQTVIILVLVGLFFGGLTWLQANSGIEDLVNEPIRALRYFLPCVLFEFLLDSEKKYQRIVWGLITGILIYTMIVTLVELQVNPMIARILANGSTDAELTQYRMRNIAGFELSYGIGLTFPLWTSLFFEDRRVHVRIFSFIAMIITMYYVIEAQYMTLLLLCLLSFLISYFMKAKTTATKIIGVFITLLLVSQAGNVLLWISTFDVGDTLYNKLTNMANFLNGSGTLQDTTSRAALYGDALSEFFHNPLWGNENSAAAPVSHSTILGTAASTGLLGLGAYLISVWFCFRESKWSLGICGLDIRPFITGFIIFLVLAVLNPVSYSYEISAVLFLYIPLTLQILKPDGKLEETNAGYE